jgi:hypothetical protein
VVIPATIGGGTVTEIGEKAFLSNQTLTAVTIPEGVTTIDSYAFYGCTSMTSITEFSGFNAPTPVHLLLGTPDSLRDTSRACTLIADIFKHPLCPRDQPTIGAQSVGKARGGVAHSKYKHVSLHIFWFAI